MSTNSGVHVRNRHQVGQDGMAATRDTHGPPGFGPAVVGISYADARDGEQSQSPDIAPGAIDGTVHIAFGTIGLDLFAETIVPPRVLDALPALPDADFVEGSLVFLTTDGKLYRNYADVWTVEVDGADILANSITAGQISAGAIGTTELAADAIIANVANVGDTVVIDSTGITILDGAITIADYSGSSVLGPAGFGGSWAEFVVGGVYNGEFNAGVFSGTDITVQTLVGTASTEADYLASLSIDVPHWVLSHVTADTGVAWRLFDDPSGIGTAITFRHTLGTDASSDLQIFQDVPVLAGHDYEVYANLAFYLPTDAWTTFGSDLDIEVQWRDESHALISTSGSASDTLSDIAPSRGYILLDAGTAPQAAKYARVVITSFSTGTGVTPGGSVAVTAVKSVVLRPRFANTLVEVGPWQVLGTDGFHEVKPLSGSVPAPGMLHIESGNGVFIENVNEGATTSPALVLSDGGLAWTTGFNAPDVHLFRGAANRLDLASGDTLRLREGYLEFGNGSAEHILRLSNPALRFVVNSSPIMTLVTGGRAIFNDAYLELIEVTAPSAAPANSGRLFLRDNGAGKTQLCIIYASGAIQVLNTQP